MQFSLYPRLVQVIGIWKRSLRIAGTGRYVFRGYSMRACNRLCIPFWLLPTMKLLILD